MKYSAVIFDLDGVICHTDHYHYLAWKELADEIGVHFDESINNRLRGVSRMESLEIILQNYNGAALTQDEKLALAEKKNILYQQLLAKMTTADLSDEVFATLESLRKMGILLAIGSSSKNAPLILKQIGLSNYFDAISDGNNIINSKPHPEVFLKAAQMLSEQPSHCIVVEDALAGVQAAIAAGMESAAIGDAARGDFATYNLDTFSQLAQICK